MKEVVRYKLSELYELSSGISSTPEQAGHGYPFCSFRTVFNNAFLPDELADLMDTSEQERVVYSIKAGDVFLTRTSETVDELGMSSVAVKDYPNATFSGFLKRLRPISDKAYPKYMALFFRSSYFRKTVTNKAVMTLRASFNEDIFNDIEVFLPPLNDQIFIGDLLYEVECYVRNNNAICSDLEAMAKLLYDYWFVQFDFPDENGRPYKSSGGKMVWNEELKKEIPEGWKVGNLYSVADFVNGLACQKYRPVDESQKLPVIKISEMHNGIGSDVEWARDDVPSKYIIDDGDILFSWSASLEVMLWNKGKGVLNQHIFNVVPKAYHKFFVYQVLKGYVINFIKMAEARKTTMGHITTDHLLQSRIVLPDQSIVKKYGCVVEGIYKEYINRSRENLQLASLRDFLLPMLMNGQVKVGN